MIRKKFSIGGMSCSACSLGIEKTVKKLNGVINVQISLMDKSMVVEFSEEQASVTLIMATVEKLGYTIVPFEKSLIDNGALKTKKRFFISLLILIPLMYFSMGKMFGLPSLNAKINLPIQCILALIILVINKKFFTNGFRAIKNLSPNMDTLVSIGSLSAFIYSAVEMILLFVGKDITHVFFESSAMVLVLVTLGKWLEDYSKDKTSAEIEKLSNLIPKTVTIIKDGKEQTVLTAELVEGDLIMCKVGDYVAIDGVVIDGYATLDKSAITGESLPEECSVDSLVTSGSIVKSGYLVIKAKKVGNQTLFSQIVQAVKDAGASKAPIQKLADKISGWFVPTVTLLAIATFVIWYLISVDLYKSFNFAISVLVVSCPCALGLATPVAIMAGTGKGASMGILFKNAESLQKAQNINCAVFDKTATITQGKPSVVDFTNYSNLKNEEIFSIAFALEEKSNHPYAQSIKDFCKYSDKEVNDFTYEIGKGVRGKIDGKEYQLGSFNVSQYLLSQHQGKSVISLTVNSEMLAVFVIADVIKKDSSKSIYTLNQMGVKTVMLTGDNTSTARSIAEQSGIKEYHSNVMPQDKLEKIREYQKRGFYCAMIGDGINDSPALKGADVGVAMGNGTDIAIDSADVVLVNGSLGGVIDAIGISKKTNAIIKGNLFWAFFYNVLAIPIAGGALSVLGIILTPTLSAGAMCLSSLFVVTNALRINGYGKQKNKTKHVKKIEIQIKGMMCGHCERKVKEILERLGLTVEKVDYKKGMAQVVGKIDKYQLKIQLQNTGFELVE